MDFQSSLEPMSNEKKGLKMYSVVMKSGFMTMTSQCSDDMMKECPTIYWFPFQLPIILKRYEAGFFYIFKNRLMGDSLGPLPAWGNFTSKNLRCAKACNL